MKDKVVVITGSTSGIGLGIAKKFASEGASVVINGFGIESEIDQIIAELTILGATDVMYNSADLSKPEEIDAMFTAIIDSFAKVDILVNNAGIQFVSPIDEFPADKWELIMRVCLNASFYTIQNALPSMKNQQWGRIINLKKAVGSRICYSDKL